MVQTSQNNWPQLSFSQPSIMCPSTLATLMVLLGSLGAIIYLLHTLLLPNHRKNDRKLSPGPLALPIVGNLHLLGNLPHQSLYHLAKKYGPLMSMRLGHVSTIVVSSPEAAELFLKTHDTVFASRPRIQASDIISYGTTGMAFTEYGSYWRNVRKLCMLHLLGASKIDSFASMRREELGFLVDSLKKDAIEQVVVDFSKSVGALVQNMTCKMVFGQSNNDEFNLKPFINECLFLVGAFNLADYVPFLGALDLQGLTQKLKACNQTMDKALEKIIDEHERDACSLNKQQKDFIDVLLSFMNQPMNSHDEKLHILDRTNIKAIILEMTIAAFDTSATAIEWTFSELIKNPRVMKCLQEELVRIVGMDRMVEEKDLSKLTYLDMVIKESLRLHPVAPLLIPRESMEDVMINGYYIPKKSRIIVNAWAIGRDPKAWLDYNVEEFFPERFKGSNLDLRGHDFQLIPFGSGRRTCPGMYLGLTTVRLLVAQLVHCFNWEVPNGVVASGLDMSEKFGLSMPRANPLMLVPTYRLKV